MLAEYMKYLQMKWYVARDLLQNNLKLFEICCNLSLKWLLNFYCYINNKVFQVKREIERVLLLSNVLLEPLN